MGLKLPRCNTFVAYLGPDVDFVLGVVPGGARDEEGVRPNLHERTTMESKRLKGRVRPNLHEEDNNGI